jgi:xylulose-5-phosphate/fructose-6-phosphate phosphoketolase
MCSIRGGRGIHVRGYKEEGTITTPFDMTVLNDMLGSTS